MMQMDCLKERNIDCPVWIEEISDCGIPVICKGLEESLKTVARHFDEILEIKKGAGKELVAQLGALLEGVDPENLSSMDKQTLNAVFAPMIMTTLDGSMRMLGILDEMEEGILDILGDLDDPVEDDILDEEDYTEDYN
jgi:hypothetical protein